MYNLLIASGVSMALYLALDRVTPWPWWATLLIGLVAGIGVMVLLARRTSGQLRARMAGVESALTAGQTEAAIAALERSRDLGKWQIALDQAIDGQIGVIYWAHKQDAERATPYLRKAMVKNWQAKAMLAAIHYKARRFDQMVSVFDQTIKFNRKEPLLYAAYAWCEAQRGKTARAMEILADGIKRLPNHEGLTRNLQALREGKKMKMRAFEPDWWAFHLERPPAQMLRGGVRRPTGRVPRR